MNRFFSAPLLAAMALSIGAAGCGSGMMARRPETGGPIPQQQAEELDALEGTIEAEESSLLELDPLACPDRCHSVDAICDASERICEIARELVDENVDARCERATQRCHAARSDVSSGCPCALEVAPAVASCVTEQQRSAL